MTERPLLHRYAHALAEAVGIFVFGGGLFIASSELLCLDNSSATARASLLFIFSFFRRAGRVRPADVSFCQAAPQTDCEEATRHSTACNIGFPLGVVLLSFCLTRMPTPMSSTNFKKQGPRSALAMFEAEADGLAELKKAGAVRVPEVYDVGADANGAYIEMERFKLDRGSQSDAAALGAGLAALHRHTTELYGWHRDNTIGPTPQHNPQSDDWIAFFRTHRLQFQLDLAAANGYAGELQDLGSRLAERLDDFFEGCKPQPSLLHGDLWSGNWGVADGVPVISTRRSTTAIAKQTLQIPAVCWIRQRVLPRVRTRLAANAWQCRALP